MSRGPDCLSDLVLDARRLGQLRQERAAAVEAHLEACAGCARRREELAADAAAFSARFAPAGLAEETLERAGARTSRRRRRLFALLVPAAAAVAVVLLVLPPAGPGPEPPGVRSKGGAGLAVWLSRGGSVTPAEDGGEFSAGDALRFRLHPGPHGYALLVGVEADGDVSVYVPAGGSRSTPVPPGRWTDCPHAVELDGSRGWERLVALYSDRPLEAEAVRRAVATAGRLKDAGHLPMEGAGAQATFLLDKP